MQEANYTLFSPMYEYTHAFMEIYKYGNNFRKTSP